MSMQMKGYFRLVLGFKRFRNPYKNEGRDPLTMAILTILTKNFK
jgi:hypothetical protein